MVWKMWKEGFERWEKVTSEYMEKVLESPAVLYPSGKILGAVMKGKSKVGEAARKWWGGWGLPTKHDQERALHTLNQLESRMLDLEEELRELKRQQTDEARD